MATGPTAGWFGDRALLAPLAYSSLDALLRARVERADGKADGTTDDERDHAGDRREKRRVHQHEPEDTDDNDRQTVQAQCPQECLETDDDADESRHHDDDSGSEGNVHLCGRALGER